MRGPAAFQFLWEYVLVPLALLTAPGIEEAARSFAPDVLVADQQILAGAVTARRNRIRWTTSAATPAEPSHPFEQLPRLAALADARGPTGPRGVGIGGVGG